MRFLFRHKVTSTSGNERRLVHFPRIEGFSDPPILIPEPRTDKTKNWAIKLENVRAHGVELWFMEYRYTGNADVTGGFELVPGRKLEVGPAHADFTVGELGLGKKRPLATGVRGSLDFRFRPTNPDPIPGLEIFRQISAKARLTGELVDLEAANLYLSDASLLAVRRGKASLDARLELIDGRFVPESFVSVRAAENVHLAQARSALSGRLDVEVRARARGAEPPRLVVDARFSGAGMSLRTGSPTDPADIGVRLLQATRRRRTTPTLRARGSSNRLRFVSKGVRSRISAFSRQLPPRNAYSREEPPGFSHEPSSPRPARGRAWCARMRGARACASASNVCCSTRASRRRGNRPSGISEPER